MIDMENNTKNTAALRSSVDDLFSTIDQLLKENELTNEDKAWLDKELEEMEQKLRAFKKSQQEKVAASR